MRARKFASHVAENAHSVADLARIQGPTLKGDEALRFIVCQQSDSKGGTVLYDSFCGLLPLNDKSAIKKLSRKERMALVGRMR